MATAVDSAAPREESSPTATLWFSTLQTWHLLSLDAPTVAALWSWFFARAMRVDLPWYAPLLLGLGTWLIYVADRILDGLRQPLSAPLHRRHHFHAQHRVAFLRVTVLVAGVLIWLICAKMSPIARREDTVLFFIALLYLFLVHKRRETDSWLPKELAVGIVFAAATAVPAWSRLETEHLILLPAVAVFAALCWLNCVAIERWESSMASRLNRKAQPELAASHLTTRWAANHLPVVAWSLAGIAAVLAAIEVPGRHFPGPFDTAPIYLSALIAALCFAALDRYQGKFSTLGLRIAADAILLTPLLFLPFLG